MSPGSSTTSGSLTQLRPERGQSYIFDDATDGFPKRAYSVGSNPVRPKTTGHTYIDMTGKVLQLLKCTTFVGFLKIREVLLFLDKKCCSEDSVS